MSRLTGVKDLARRRLPARMSDWIRRRHLAAWPPVGRVRLGDLRRLGPISEHSGWNRGTPIDRYYIERFLERHAGSGGGGDLRGRVLEIKEDRYASRFADAAALETVEVLDIDPDNPRATIHADLTRPEQVPAESFD